MFHLQNELNQEVRQVKIWIVNEKSLTMELQADSLQVRS